VHVDDYECITSKFTTRDARVIVTDDRFE